MKIIEPYIMIEGNVNGQEILKHIEKAGRVCYKSEAKTKAGSAEFFIQKILESGHESVIEHYAITVRVICDRGVSHEIVRHRIASYSQESTRYCNYSDEKFGNELCFINPCFWEGEEDRGTEWEIWKETLQRIEENYMRLLSLGAKPEEARSILPNSLKTEILITMNLREWRHFLKLRTSSAAHPQMRQIAKMIHTELSSLIPVVFEDIVVE